MYANRAVRPAEPPLRRILLIRASAPAGTEARRSWEHSNIQAEITVGDVEFSTAIPLDRGDPRTATFRFRDGIPDKLEQPGGHWQIEGKDPEIRGIVAKAVIKFYQACIAGLCAPTPIPENAAVHLEITAMDNGLLHRVVVILGPPYAPQQGEFKTSADKIGKEQTAIFDFTVSLGDPRVYTIG